MMTVELKFDHAVHFVDHPGQIPAELAERGIHAVQGGRHEQIGTYNALTYFDLSYIEWIGIFDRQLLPPHRDTEKYGLIETLYKDGYREGLSRIALRTGQIEELAARLAAKGLEVIGPVDCSRKRPDGKLLQWKLLFAGTPEEGLPLPFFIQWEESDEARREDLVLSGTIQEHSLGPVSLQYVAFAVRDLEQTVRDWTDWLALPAEAAVYDDYWKGKKQILQAGEVSLAFIEPDEGGPAWHALQDRGERPFALGLNSGKNREFRQVVQLHAASYQLG